ncbi:hypothetical protein ACXJJ3_42020 (plasmid) [Kribbella sp. WER1]
MSSTANTQLSRARNRRAFAYSYSRLEQMLAGHTRPQLRRYRQTWQKRLEQAEFGSEAYALALGAWTYLNEHLAAGSCQRPARRTTRRYTVRGSKW